jgi:hypothetical protein
MIIQRLLRWSTTLLHWITSLLLWDMCGILLSPGLILLLLNSFSETIGLWWWRRWLILLLWGVCMRGLLHKYISSGFPDVLGHVPTCWPPGIAPYVPGLYPPAACCCGWLHCWLGAWLWDGGAHWPWVCGVVDWYPVGIASDARTRISRCNSRAPTPIRWRWGSCMLLPGARLLIA